MVRQYVRWAAMALGLLTAFLFVTAVRAEDPVQGDRFVPGRVLIKPRPGVETAALVSPLTEEGLRVAGGLPQIGYVILSVPAGTELGWAQRLAASPLVENAQPEFVYNVLREPNDYFFSRTKSDDTTTYYYQWNLRAVNAPSAWDITTGSPDFVIAIVDTGVDDGHDDLVGKVVQRVDYINEYNLFDGMGFHGTHVAGIAAANTNNYSDTKNFFWPGGMAGMSWDAKLMSVKVADHFGKAPDTAAAQGIIYAADHGAKIINLSFGGEDKSQMLQDAVNYAYNKGILVVAAAGNCGDPNSYRQADCVRVNPPIYPAADDNVLAVGAVNRQNQRCTFSEYGGYVAVVAPGEEILSTVPNQMFGTTKGTSQAAPHVSALANLIWSVNPSLTNAQVANIITSTAVNLGPPGKDDEYGYGLIDGRAALAKATEPTPTPTPTPIPVLLVSPPVVGVLAKPGGVVTRSLGISTGSVNLPWSAMVPTPAPWLSISPTSGTAPATITVSMNPSVPAAGRYQSSIDVSAPGAQPSQASVPVSLVLTDTILYRYIPLATIGWAGGW